MAVGSGSGSSLPHGLLELVKVDFAAGQQQPSGDEPQPCLIPTQVGECFIGELPGRLSAEGGVVGGVCELLDLFAEPDVIGHLAGGVESFAVETGGVHLIIGRHAAQCDAR